MPPSAHHRPISELSARLLRVRLRADGPRKVLSVAGEVDLASVGVLGAAISAALRSGADELLIDLTETEFMDSAGLHVLVDTDDELRRLDRRLEIICPPGAVRRVFDLTCLDEALAIHDDAASAERCPARAT